MNDLERPYAREWQRVLEYLESLTPAEEDALLRKSGILDENGQLAERYKAGGEPVDNPAMVTR